MSLLLYDNNALSEFASVNVSVSSGTLTNLTSPDKMLNRNLADAYYFSCSESTTLTITLTYGLYLKCMGLLATNFTGGGITLKHDASTATADNTVTKYRYKNGVALVDRLYLFDSDSLLPSAISFQLSIPGGASTYRIGGLWRSDGLNIGVKLPVNYSDNDTSTIDVSKGGQVYASPGETIETIKFETVPLSKLIARGDETQGKSVRDINIRMGSHSPLIFLSQNKDNIHIYGYQKPLATFKQIQALDESTEWWWQCSFSLTGEL